MNRKTATITLALPLGVLIGSLGPRWIDEAPAAQQADLSPVLGVVDLDTVRQGYPKARELREAWIADMEAQGIPGQELFDLVQETLKEAKMTN